MKMHAELSCKNFRKKRIKEPLLIKDSTLNFVRKEIWKSLLARTRNAVKICSLCS